MFNLHLTDVFATIFFLGGGSVKSGDMLAQETLTNSHFNAIFLQCLLCIEQVTNEKKI